MGLNVVMLHSRRSMYVQVSIPDVFLVIVFVLVLFVFDGFITRSADSKSNWFPDN